MSLRGTSVPHTNGSWGWLGLWDEVYCFDLCINTLLMRRRGEEEDEPIAFLQHATHSIPSNPACMQHADLRATALLGTTHTLTHSGEQISPSTKAFYTLRFASLRADAN